MPVVKVYWSCNYKQLHFGLLFGPGIVFIATAHFLFSGKHCFTVTAALSLSHLWKSPEPALGSFGRCAPSPFSLFAAKNTCQVWLNCCTQHLSLSIVSPDSVQAWMWFYYCPPQCDRSSPCCRVSRSCEISPNEDHLSLYSNAIPVGPCTCDFGEVYSVQEASI